MAQSNSMSSLEALIQAAQYLEENGRKLVRLSDVLTPPPPPCHLCSCYEGCFLLTAVVVFSLCFRAWCAMWCLMCEYTAH